MRSQQKKPQQSSPSSGSSENENTKQNKKLKSDTKPTIKLKSTKSSQIAKHQGLLSPRHKKIERRYTPGIHKTHTQAYIQNINKKQTKIKKKRKKR